MPLSFIADIHISPLTVSYLQKLGYKISRVTDFLSASVPDNQIIELARTQDAVIITQDLDFSYIIALSGQNKPSVISLRVGNANPQVISQLLQNIIPQISKDLEEGAIVSVEESKFRIRKLPVK